MKKIYFMLLIFFCLIIFSSSFALISCQMKDKQNEVITDDEIINLIDYLMNIVIDAVKRYYPIKNNSNQIKVEMKKEVKDSKTIETVKINFLQTMEVNNNTYVPKKTLIGMKVEKDKFDKVIKYKIISVSIFGLMDKYLNIIQNENEDWFWCFLEEPYDPLVDDLRKMKNDLENNKDKKLNEDYGVITADKISVETEW